MSKASKFDWSLLDRKILFDIMYLLNESIVGKTLTVQKFQDTVIRHVKKYIPIKGARVRDQAVEKSWVYIGGCYYSGDDQERKTSIEIMLAYHPKEKYITINNIRFKRFCKTFADTILHEIIHMRQFRKRKFKDLPDYASTASKDHIRKEQQYLGRKDEIDAYAFNIACELQDKFGNNFRKKIKYLNENQKGVRRLNNCYTTYLKAFEHEHQHPVIQRLKKRVVFYMPKAKVGKPFRSADWIKR